MWKRIRDVIRSSFPVEFLLIFSISYSECCVAVSSLHAPRCWFWMRPAERLGASCWSSCIVLRIIHRFWQLLLAPESMSHSNITIFNGMCRMRLWVGVNVSLHLLKRRLHFKLLDLNHRAIAFQLHRKSQMVCRGGKYYVYCAPVRFESLFVLWIFIRI